MAARGCRSPYAILGLEEKRKTAVRTISNARKRRLAEATSQREKDMVEAAFMKIGTRELQRDYWAGIDAVATTDSARPAEPLDAVAGATDFEGDDDASPPADVRALRQSVYGKCKTPQDVLRAAWQEQDPPGHVSVIWWLHHTRESRERDYRRHTQGHGTKRPQPIKLEGDMAKTLMKWLESGNVSAAECRLVKFLLDAKFLCDFSRWKHTDKRLGTYLRGARTGHPVTLAVAHLCASTYF